MARFSYGDDQAFTLADDAATIQRITRAYPAAELRAKKFGDWTAVEVIGHVADMAEIFAERVRRMVTEDRPRLVAIDQDAVHAERRNNERDPMALAKRVQSAHGEIVRLLMDRANRARLGVHEEMGEVDAAHIAGYQANHSHEHVTELAAAFPPAR